MPKITIYFYSWHQATILSSQVVDLTENEHNKYLKRDFPVKCNGFQEIWLDDKDFIHRDNNLPAVIEGNYEGNIIYYVHGKLHRTPAVIDGDYEGNITYYVHGKLHRTNGPAVQKEKAYWINGLELTKEEWNKITAKRFYFLREKIKTLKNLLEIPELYDEVYYKHKNDFLSLLRKI